jgi:type VI secretion system FHA domain protein
MYLTLEVISPNGAALGENRRIVVGEAGALIGRDRANDWVIDDPYISREQACIRYVNGAFYLEGIGTNPIAMNDPKSTVPNHEPQILRSGGRFFLDQYEIEATLSAAQRVSEPPPLEDPFADEPVAAAPPPKKSPSRRDPLQSLAAVERGDGADDVRRVFGIGVQEKEPTLSPVEFQQIPPIHEGFAPGPGPVGRFAPTPKPGPARPAPAAGVDDWDHTGYTTVEPKPSPKLALAEPPPPQKLEPEPQHAALARRPTPSPGVLPASPPPSTPMPRQVAGINQTSADLSDLLRSIGVPGGQLSAETALELGQVYRIMVDGLMGALQARAQVKTQFRLQITHIQANDNNPLKFSPNVEAALHTLLVERNRGYMGTTRAFQAAFDDLRDHQIAILAGIRAAYDSMLSEFSPARLQEKLEGDSKRGLLKVGKSRFQELYADHFRTLTADADECFRKLFAEVFGEAYEKQLEELKRAGGTSRG